MSMIICWHWWTWPPERAGPVPVSACPEEALCAPQEPPGGPVPGLYIHCLVHYNP